MCSVRLPSRLDELSDLSPRLDHTFSRDDVPPNGIYLFFESGEQRRTAEGRIVDRVVRVGTHRADGRLPDRLRIHFSATRRRSVFRLHLGAASLAQLDLDDPRLTPWLNRHGGPMPDVEALVIDALRHRFTFACLPIAGRADRLATEAALIGALSTHHRTEPSPDWLGRHTIPRAIRASGLWNIRGV